MHSCCWTRFATWNISKVHQLSSWPITAEESSPECLYTQFSLPRMLPFKILWNWIESSLEAKKLQKSSLSSLLMLSWPRGFPLLTSWRLPVRLLMSLRFYIWSAWIPRLGPSSCMLVLVSVGPVSIRTYHVRMSLHAYIMLLAIFRCCFKPVLFLATTASQRDHDDRRRRQL